MGESDSEVSGSGVRGSEMRGSEMRGSEMRGPGISSGGSLLNFFLQVSQILEPMEICGALSHIHAVTGLRSFLRLLLAWPGISKGLQQE